MKNQPTISIDHSMSFFVAVPDINHHSTNESHYFVTNGNQQEPTIDLSIVSIYVQSLTGWTANNLCGYWQAMVTCKLQIEKAFRSAV